MLNHLFNFHLQQCFFVFTFDTVHSMILPTLSPEYSMPLQLKDMAVTKPVWPSSSWTSCKQKHDIHWQNTLIQSQPGADCFRYWCCAKQLIFPSFQNLVWDTMTPQLTSNIILQVPAFSNHLHYHPNVWWKIKALPQRMSNIKCTVLPSP
jgi:hypothetical protein